MEDGYGKVVVFLLAQVFELFFLCDGGGYFGSPTEQDADLGEECP